VFLALVGLAGQLGFLGSWRAGLSVMLSGLAGSLVDMAGQLGFLRSLWVASSGVLTACLAEMAGALGCLRTW